MRSRRLVLEATAQDFETALVAADAAAAEWDRAGATSRAALLSLDPEAGT